jgi:septum site-determining protein MinD
MGKVFVITSGKGGVGKTTSAINLGAAINSYDENVIVVDANLTTPNVGLHLGAPIVPVTLNHVLREEANVEDAIYRHESGTKIIPADLSIKEIGKLRFDKIKDVADTLREYADYVVFDSPAGLGEDALSVLKSGDEIIVVTHPEIPAVTDALKTIKMAEEHGKKIKGVILNRVRMADTEMPLFSVKEMLEYPVLGMIPDDKNMQKALSRRDAILHTHPSSKASRAYKKIAAKLIGKEHLYKETFSEKLLRGLGLDYS